MIVSSLSVVLACLSLSCVKSQPDYKCISPNNAMKVSINNRINQTGHFISQVEFTSKGGQLQDPHVMRETDLWTVNVEQKTDNCEGVEYLSRLIFTISAPYRQPQSDYELFPKIGHYKFHSKVETWPRAREICAEEGAHLVIINSEKEADVMKILFARFPQIAGTNDNNWAWVGAREKEGANGQYVTMYGTALNDTGFSRWSPNEPNNPSAGDYLLVNRANGGLADVPVASGWKQAFICEQELW